MLDHTKARPSLREGFGARERDAVQTRPAKKDKGGSGKLDRQALLLLGVNALFTCANALSGTFVNIYIWKIKNDYALLGWFAVVHQLTMSLTFWLAGKWVKEGNKMNALRIGVLLAAVFYGIVLLLGTRAASYIALLGFVQGISSGLFWLAFNVVYFEITNRDNRDRFNGVAGLLGSVAGMVVPWISGYLITRQSGNAGYRLIFSISLAVFLAGALLTFLLHKRQVDNSYDWRGGFRGIRKRDNPWRIIGLAMVAQGLREGIFGFMVALLVYVSTRSEMKIGNFSLYTSAVALASFYLAGRFLKPRYRHWGMFAGVVMLSAFILPLFWGVSYGTLLIFGIGTAMFIPLYTIPSVSIVFDQIGSNEESVRRREEYIIFRELALNAGRFIGTIAFIAVISRSTAPTVINVMLLAFGSSPILVWLLLRRRLATEMRTARS
ncbi:MFS transporter [Cohnella nanjingensis]|uniref:MFS transporter n=1 Tax=Cohnella nanjingensis TaxID=1387779 RepID=A0A7X0RLZ1_9BACL|nr:MFS transporter [Cohnella nanjingensis]MBB6669948.1 MFS transporter [Cohnella nanjingensis]